MAEGLDEHHRIVGGVLIVVRGLRHKPGGLVFLQFSHGHHLQNGIKISRITATSKMVLYERKSHAARSQVIVFAVIYCCIAQAMAWPPSSKSSALMAMRFRRHSM